MDNGVAAGLKTTLRGVALPAEKARLLEYAVRQHAEPAQLDALKSLSDREFHSLDDVVEELLHVQPPTPHRASASPHEESGEPPGGEDYTRAHPDDTGRVRER
jgi:hypothetical protein